MGANLTSKLPSTDANFTDYLPSPNPNHERFVLHSVPESKVGKLIEELDEGKGLGWVWIKFLLNYSNGVLMFLFLY